MPTFEITSPDGRVLEIEGDKAPSEAELNQIFNSIPKASTNQSALSNIKSSDDLPDEGTTLLDRFNQARENAAQIRSKYKQDMDRYYDNMPEKEKGMSWIEYAKLCKKYNYDFAQNQGKGEFVPLSAGIELNPLKFAWKNSILGGIGGDLYRNQKDKRAAKYTDNTEVLSEIPQQAIEDWKQKGQMKAGETLMRSDWSRTIPFVGSGNTLDEITDIQKIINKRNNGEQLSRKEITELNSYIMDVAEMQYRGISFGGKLIQGALELPSFAGEFMATGGLAAIGKQAVQKTLTKGLQNAAKEEVGKRLTKGLLEGAAGASIRTIGMPQRVAENYGMRKLNDSLGLTDKGEVVLETAQESPAKTFLKAYGDTVIENWSEEMGAGIAESAGFLGKSATKYSSELAEKLFGRNAKAALLKAIRKFRPNATVKDIATRAGFNGILGEMGEERAGDVLRAVFGIDDREDLSTFEKICEAINPGSEELLLELGLFSIPGSMSFAASRVANHLRRRNLEENDINDYMRLTSELEKENLLHDIADNNDLSQTIDFQEKVNELKNRYYTQNLNAGLEEDEALATADIQAGAISNLAKNIGMDIQEVNDKFAINTQSLTDKQAQEQYNEDTQMVLQGRVEKHNQSMYRSPINDFEEFYNSVFEKEEQAKNDNKNINKSYFLYNNSEVLVRVPHDTIVHDENEHKLPVEKWQDILSNLHNPVNASISKKPRFNGEPVLLKIIGDNGDSYGAVVEFFDRKKPILTTAFEDTEKNIDKWIKKEGVAQAKNTSSVTTKGMLLGQNPTNIINYVKEKFKPNSNNSIHYQMINENFDTSYTKPERSNIEKEFGDSVENIVDSVRADIENIIEENYLNEDEFNLEDIRIYGSYSTGRNKKDSDLDFLVQYSGSMREDDAFNMLNGNGLEYVDAKGKKIRIDINPVNVNESGSIADHLRMQAQYLIEKDNPLFQSAYHGTPHRFEKFSIDNIGTGEGAQAHGWGLYFAANKDVSDNYRVKLVNRSMNGFNEYTFTINNEPISEDLNFFLSNNLNGGVMYNAANTDNAESKKELIDSIKWHIDYLRKGDASTIRLINMLQQAIDKIENNPKISITKFLKEVPEYEKHRFKILSEQAKKEAKNEGKKADIQYLLKWIKAQQKPFVDERNKELARLSELEKLDIDNIKINRRSGQLFEVDIPDNDVLLDEDKELIHQSDKVQRAIEKIYADAMKSNNVELTNAIGITGKEIYRGFARYFGSNKEASEFLNSYGIKGITYNGLQDGRCYVIFDDKAINVLETFYQGGDQINNARGFTYQRYNFDGTTKDNLIVLLKNKADKSTLLHEFAHVYLTTLNNLAQDNARAKDLLLTVNKWLRYNGQEYTTAQHEKFANSFVAYVRSGKAPTYGLKRAFENFRRWLNDFYNDLQFNDKVELDDETKKVFDELIGDISVDAKEERMQQILDDAKQNALLKLSYEFADKHKVQPLMLTDRQRRYRDTAYDIMFYALHNSKDENGEPLVKDRKELYMLFGDNKDYNKKNKGVKHRREQLEQYLLEVDDVFSGNDGFLPEWGEFFGDPGVSYDNAVTRADADLARQALEVITDKRYLYDVTNNNNLFSDEDIKKTEYELDYILEVFETNKDDRDVICGAFYTWIDSVHEYMQDDMLNRWENRTNEIERYESLSKFQQAKEDLKLYAATLKGQGDYAQQFAQYARAIIKRLDFMTESDKSKIFDKLKEFNSFREVEENLDDVMDYAETLNEVTERKLIADQIVKEVKQTIHTWQNGIRKTKYTYPANKLFTRLREIEKMKVEEVRDLYDEVVNEEFTPDYNSDAVNEEDYYSTIEKLYIKFKANDKYYLPTEFLKDLRDRIQGAKFTAKVARDEMDFERKMQQINLIDECAQALNVRKKEIDKNDKIKDIGQVNVMGANLNGMLKMIFNDTIKNKFSLDYLYAKKDGQVGKDRREFLDKAKKIWGYREGRIGDVELFNRFINMTQKEDDLSIYERYSPSIEDGSYRVTSEDKESGKQITERTVNVRENKDNASLWQSELKTLSRMEVLYFYIQSKNEESYKILTDEEKGQFNKADFDNLINQLTDQEKMLGDVMQLAAEKYWDALNAYHIKKYHTELGKVKGYFPRRSATTEVKVLDMFNDFTQPTTTGKFQKQRTAGPGTRVNESNALAVLFDHIEKANTIIIMGEQLDLMNHVFNNSDLAHKIENVWGEKVQKEFYHQITSNLFTGQSIMSSLSETFLAKLVGNAVKAAIFFKPQIGIKQVISFMNYGKGDDYVTAQEWAGEFAKQTFRPSEWKKNIEYMMNIPYLKDRFSRGGSTDALKRELESRIFSKASLLDEFFGMPVSVGDISAIILGGKPYINALRKKGYSEEQAIKIFIETTVNDQQSSIPSTLSNMQRNSGKNALSKMFFAFQNTPWQYFRQCTTTVMQAIQTGNKKDALKAGKMLFLYGWVFPAIFSMASSLSPLIFAGTGDDDQLLKDINPFITFSSLVTQHPIFGELIKAVIDGYDGKIYNSQDLMTRYIRSANKLVRDIRKDKVTVEDVWDAVVAFGEPATGIPLNSISNFASGIFDAATGNFAEGAIKMMGYSDYKARQVTGRK